MTTLLEINVSPQQQVAEITFACKKIIASKPEVISFVEHSPHPIKFVKILLALKPQDYNPLLVFHIYGDFTLRYPNWFEMGELLKGTRVLFLTASSRQKKLTAAFSRGLSNNIGVLPFAIDRRSYFYSPQIRRQERESYGLDPENKAILYTGRFSLQKNTLLISQEIEKYLILNPKVHYFLAGEFDDLAAPFFGIKMAKGSYEQIWRSWHDQLNIQVKKRIHLLGLLNATELLKVYNMSDVYVSLSVHHDEDFGMSPLESLACGCPAILSNWGGYADFAITDQCDLVETKIDKTGLHVNTSVFQKNLLNRLRGSFPEEQFHQQREKTSESYLSHFSIEAVGEKLKSLLQMSYDPFQGFKENASAFTTELFKKKAIAFPLGPGKDEQHKHYYSNYLDN